MRYKLFTTPMCPKCPAMKEFMAKKDIDGEIINAHTPEGLSEARKYVISSVPLVVFLDDEGTELARCSTSEEAEDFLKRNANGQGNSNP